VITLPSLYPHQEDHRDLVRAAITKHQCVIACAPPGAGKTRLAKWILGSYLNRPKRDDESGYATFAVHRQGLAIAVKFTLSGLPSSEPVEPLRNSMRLHMAPAAVLDLVAA
jgi:hypothetical protein